eukprot:3443932-Heterocapsa_arctica.AAC.1
MTTTARARPCSSGLRTLRRCAWRSILVSYALDARTWHGFMERHGRCPRPRGPVGVRGGC